MRTISKATPDAIAVCVAAFLVGGCGGPAAQNALPSPTQQNVTRGAPRADGARRETSGSWMLPEAKHEDLIYVTNTDTNSVGVYAYKSRKLVGTLANIKEPYGTCSDASGNVWIIGWGKGQIFEFPHAVVKPVRVLDVEDSADPYDCSVDPTTGNLAITDWGYNWLKGEVLIFRNGSDEPEEVTGPSIWFYYGCTYDEKGNLYADGWDAYLGDVFALGELPKGGKEFKNIVMPPLFKPPYLGGIRWDGKYVAIGNTGALWKYAVSGNRATFAGYTALTSRWPMGFFWIRTFGSGERSVIAPDHAGNPTAVQYWRYPAGGHPMGTITRGLHEPFGVTFSVAGR
ncbi:MAG: hypothetical protein WBP75_02615 [Candidatus Cybelea sp.]